MRASRGGRNKGVHRKSKSKSKEGKSKESGGNPEKSTTTNLKKRGKKKRDFTIPLS